MLPEAFKEERGVVSFEVKPLSITETGQDRREAFPPTVRSHPLCTLQLVVEGRSGEVSFQKRPCKIEGQPRSIHRQRLLSGIANALEEEELRILGELEVTCRLGVLGRANGEDFTGLCDASRFDGTKKAVEATKWLLELRPIHHSATASLALEDSGLVEVTNGLAHRVPGHAITADQLSVCREAVVELPIL